MLKFGNKEFRNLQEQVEENMKDIANLKSGQAVLDEFGIKVVGEVESVDDMPTVSEYKEATPDWEYGDAYAVGSTSPYTLYILTRANGTHDEDYWFDIGVFPMPGPQGEQGPQGPEGQQGQTGDTGPAGSSAGFGTPTATATMTTRGSAPTVNVTATGPNTEKVFNFDFYLPVATPKVTITSASGTLTLADYNILFNFEDSVVVFKPSSSLANNAYTLQRWYSSDDYIVFICLYNYTPYKTGVYRCRVDRSNRSYLIYADEAIKINKYNISTAINSSTNETAGKVLTADGNGGASWEDASAGLETVTLTTLVGNLSDADYLKVSGNNCVIIYDDNTTKVYFKKYDESSTTITYAMPLSEGSSTYVYGVEITKATKYYQVASAYMPISNSNIKSGSTIADKYLKTNGSGGAVWGDAPSQVQSDWNESSLSSPAYIKNKPTIPTVPVTDVTVNGTSVMDGTTAKILVDTVDGTIGDTTWTSLTINGSTAGIPDPQVQANWTETNTSDPSYIQNKPTIPAAQVQSDYTQSNTSAVDYIKNKPDLSIYAQSSSLATVATSGSYDDLIDKPTLFSGDYDDLTNKPDLSIYAESADLATVATTGDYDDLIDTPDLSIYAETSDLATVATTGDYDDLLNKPTIPTVDYPVTDVTVNGTSVLNNKVAAVTVPTNVSDLNNDAGYTTNTGTVTSVGLSGNNNISISGSPITSSGTITVGVASGYSIPSTTDQTDWSSRIKYCGTIGGSDATLTWNAAVLHYFNVGDTYRVTSTSFVYPRYKIGNYMICTTAGTGPAADFDIINSLESYGTVTSVGITRTSGSHLTASGTVTSSGNLSIGVESGYSIPSDTDQSAWTAKYDKPSGGIPASDLAESYYLASNPDGFITGITSGDVTTALGYTPYDASNPSGYTSNVGTVISVNNVSPVDGNVTISIPAAITITTTSGSESISDGTNTLSFGANAFTNTTIPTQTSQLTNNSGFITGIDSSDVTTALGYTPLNSTACTYQTTAPTAAISDGGVHIVYLSAEPSTKYSGYIYMIAEA